VLRQLAATRIGAELQYSETNVMHILFTLLGIKGFYMSRALLVHPQEELRKRHLVLGFTVQLDST
jgi:hypothetical protein